MIGYVTLGTNDITRACAFYDVLLENIGAGRFMESDTFIAWSTGQGQPSLSVTLPHDGNGATVGNGVMVALQMESSEQVDTFYEKALSLGATDEGAPGFRPPGAEAGFYGSYFRDLDGNKLCAFSFSG